MRKVAWLAFVLVVVALLIFLLVALNLPSRARSGATVVNGDANGDGVIDISDPLYLLRYLFQEGSAPVACAESPGTLEAIADLRARVAALERERDCSPTHRRPERFIDHGDGTTTDPCTGLMWLTEAIDANLDGQINQTDYVSWVEAKSLCDSLDAKGFGDWRLPSIEELASLHHVFGGSMVQRWYTETPFQAIWSAWSSTELRNDPTQAWATSLADVVDAPFFPSGKTNGRNVLAVRGPVAS